MVAAPVYLKILGDQFENRQEMLACFAAWSEPVENGAAPLSDACAQRIKKWLSAHDIAENAARPLLSSPRHLSFSVRIPAVT